MKCTLAFPQTDWVYPRVMDGKPAAGDPEHRAAREASASVPTPDSSRENFGVVELTRLVKDDGRALLVYRRTEDR